MSSLNRAYSFIEIKAIDEKKRTIEGIATTPTPDRLQDIVNPLGAKFALPIPFLWQHRHDEPIGHVVDVDPKKSGIPFKAQIEQTDEPGTLKQRLDEAWQSLKLKLVRATSIGFNPLKWSFMENGGIDFEEWDWLELSAVTIPANPDAVISAVKQFDRMYREAEGIPEFEPPTGDPGDQMFDLKAREAMLARSQPHIPSPPAPAAIGKSCRVVRLNDPAGVSAPPFIIREIRRTPR